MEVDTAGEDIGTWQAFERQLCAVRAAADGMNAWGHIALLHGFQHQVDDVHVGFYLLLHVVVLVFHLARDDILAILLLHLLHTLADEVLAVLKAVAVVVADDVAQRGSLDIALNAQQMIESLVTLGLLGSLIAGKHRCKLDSKPVGIHHLVFGIARMHTDALDAYLGTGGIEVLKLQLAQVTAVDGISPFAAELLDIEVVGAHANLLVGIESHAYVTVLHLLMVAQPAHGLYDLGNASLVVGSQQGCSVGHDEVFAHVIEQLGELLGTADNAR